MKLTYEQVIKRLNRVEYDICSKMEKNALDSWIKRFVDNSHLHGSQNGNSKPPFEALKRHYKEKIL